MKKQTAAAVKPWYVQCIRHDDRKERGRWIVAREERHGVRYFDSVGHISVDESWPATWFRTDDLAQAVADHLNSAKVKIKEARR